MLITARGNWYSMKGLRPAARSLSMRAESTGSSGGAKGSLSITTSDRASPRTSTPSQKLWLATRMALPRKRKRSSSSVREPSPCISSGRSSPSPASFSCSSSRMRRIARRLVHKTKARPPEARIAGQAASATASWYIGLFGSGMPVGA